MKPYELRCYEPKEICSKNIGVIMEIEDCVTSLELSRRAKEICPYCDEPIEKDHAFVMDDGEKVHLICAVKEDDGRDIAREHGG